MRATPAVTLVLVLTVTGLTPTVGFLAEGPRATGRSTSAPPPPPPITVTPDGGTASTTAYKSGTSVTFYAKQPASVVGGLYTVTCAVTGSVASCTPAESQVWVYTEPEPYAGYPIVVNYTSGGPGTGQLTVTLTKVQCDQSCGVGDDGYVDVNVGGPLPPGIVYQGNDRLLEPRVASALTAGPTAAFRPDELVVSHTFPGYRTIDRERAITLVYSSQSAGAKIVLPFDVTLNTDPPSELRARLEVNGIQQGSTIYYSTAGWPDGQTRRLALLFDASAFTTNSYAYRIVVTSVFSSGVYEAVLTGRLAVVNDLSSPFGRGWRVAGVQRAYASNDTLTIVGCDCTDEAHAFAVFVPDGAGGYVAPAGEYSTLSRLGSGWLRRMKDGTKHYFGPSGLQDSTVDRSGNRTTYGYDASNRLAAITDPMGWATTFSYPSGQVVVAIPGGRTATLTLSGGQLVQVTDPDARSVVFGYDGSGRLSAHTSKRGHQTTFGYDYGWLPSSASLPIAASRGYVSPRRAGLANYPSEGTAGAPKVAPLASSASGTYTDGRGKVWTLATHRSLALTLRKDPLGDSTRWSRNADGAPATLVQPNGREVRITYDANGNAIEILDVANGARWTFTYGATYSNLTRRISPTADTVNISYDALGRPNQLVSATQNIWQIGYNGRGQPVRILRSLIKGGAVQLSDSLVYGGSSGNLVWQRLVRYAGGAADTVGFSHDGAGRVTQVRDHRGGTVQFAYDAMNRVTTRTDQLSRLETWAYSAEGRDSVFTNRRGQAVTYSYDALDRLTQKIADETSVFQYDGESQLTRAYDLDSDVLFYPDALGRDTAEVQNGRRVSYTYRPGLTLRNTMRDPNGGVHTYTHDLLGRLMQLQDPEGLITTFTYDLSNRRRTRTQANGVQTTYSYDRDTEPTRIAATYGGNTLLSFDYTYDGMGSRSSWTYENGDLYSFSHDLQGQLEGATLRRADNSVIHSTTFDYDGANNRTSGGAYSGYSYDAANKLNSTTTSSYGYDLDGNLSSEADAGSNYTYAHDREGRLTAQSGPGLSVSYAYDPFGRRIQQSVNGTITTFVYDGAHVLADYDGGGSLVARYTHGTWIDELVSVRRSGATYFYLQDALGSVARILDANRNTVNSYSYLSWGEIRTQSEGVTNRFTFTGRERNPDARTMHYRARTYLPGLGRFGQEDPLGMVDGVNLYTYVRNSPCSYADPTGMQRNCSAGSFLRAAENGARMGAGAMAVVGFVRGAQVGGQVGTAAGASAGAAAGSLPGAFTGGTVGGVTGAIAGGILGAVAGAAAGAFTGAWMGPLAHGVACVFN